MTKAKVIAEKCIGCGACVGIAPDVFDLNEEGIAHNILGDDTDLPEDLVADVNDAASSCPTEAIEVE